MNFKQKNLGMKPKHAKPEPTWFVIKDDADEYHLIDTNRLRMDMLPDIMFQGTRKQCTDYINED